MYAAQVKSLVKAYYAQISASLQVVGLDNFPSSLPPVCKLNFSKDPMRSTCATVFKDQPRPLGVSTLHDAGCCTIGLRSMPIGKY